MRKWLWIAPLLLAAGCSKNRTTAPQAQQPNGATQQALTAPPVGPAATGTVSPTPVAYSSAPNPAPDPEPAAVPAPDNGAVIPRGTPLRVRVNQSLSTRRNRSGDRFSATLVDAVYVNGRDVLPRGTRVSGHVLVSQPSGRLKGRARLVMELDSVNLDGQRYRIDTYAASRVSRNHKKRNILAIAGGSGVGAAIGGIASGGTGALIGAGAGAVAGTVGAAVTGRKEVTLPAESVVRFTLGAAVRV